MNILAFILIILLSQNTDEKKNTGDNTAHAVPETGFEVKDTGDASETGVSNTTTRQKSSQTKEKNTSQPVKTVEKARIICPHSGSNNKAPLLFIEKIIIKSENGKNYDFLKNSLEIKEKTYIKTDSPLFERVRLKLLLSGLFESAELYFEKASGRGKVFLYIKVVPKGTFIIDQLFMGSSRIVPFWLGLGVTDKSFMNTGIRLGITAIGTTKAEIMDGRYQYGLGVSAFFPDFYDSYPLNTSLSIAHGSLFYRLYGENQNADPHNFLSLPYESATLKFGTFFPFKKIYVHLGSEHNFLYTDIPSEVIRHYPDGTSKQINFGLKNEFSVIGVLKLKLVYDTRDMPVLPSEGTLAQLSGQVGNPVTGSNYTFGRFDFLFEKYAKFGNQIWSFHFFGGAIMGSAPIFKKYYIGDLQDLVAPRALGINLSVAPSPDFLNTNISKFRWGTAAFKTWIRFDYPFFKRKGFIYQGNFFISAGILGLAEPSQLRYRTGDLWSSTPVDLTFDFGLHIDTKIGTFRFSIANLLGRLPVY